VRIHGYLLSSVRSGMSLKRVWSLPFQLLTLFSHPNVSLWHFHLSSFSTRDEQVPLEKNLLSSIANPSLTAPMKKGPFLFFRNPFPPLWGKIIFLPQKGLQRSSILTSNYDEFSCTGEKDLSGLYSPRRGSFLPLRTRCIVIAPPFFLFELSVYV